MELTDPQPHTVFTSLLFEHLVRAENEKPALRSLSDGVGPIALAFHRLMQVCEQTDPAPERVFDGIMGVALACARLAEQVVVPACNEDEDHNQNS